MRANQSRRATQFRALVAAQPSTVLEMLQLYGDMPHCSPARAIEADWLYCLTTCHADLLEALRNTQPDDQRFARKMTRRALARIVAVCEAWERQV